LITHFNIKASAVAHQVNFNVEIRVQPPAAEFTFWKLLVFICNGFCPFVLKYALKYETFILLPYLIFD